MASHGPQGHGHVATRTALRMLEVGSALRRQTAPFDLILRMLEGFKGALGFSKICFYPIDYNVVRLTTDGLGREAKTHLHAIDYVDKSAGAVHRLAAIVNKDSDLIKTILFDTLKVDDPEDRVKVTDRGRKIALLVHQSRLNGGPCFILQAELPPPADGPTSPEGTHQATAAHNTPGQIIHMASNSTFKHRSHSIDAASKGSKGLSHSQVMLLRIMVDIFRFRLEKLLYDYQFRAMDGDVFSTIEMVGRILRVKTLKSLMRIYLREIPQLFGFEHCTVMFHDDEQDTLYQITFGDDQEKQLAHELALRKAKSQQEVEYLHVVHAMNDAMVPSEGLIRFPCTTGITGKVFATQQTIFFNNANVQSHFLYQPDIDNITSIQEIRNLAFFAITRETGTSIGVVQLYNKLKPIVAVDIKKMRAMSRFFGGCIHNIEAITKRLTTSLAVQMQTPETRAYLDKTDAALAQQLQNWNAASKPAENVKNEIAMSSARNDEVYRLLPVSTDPKLSQYQ